jgi:hypothetical protein
LENIRDGKVHIPDYLKDVNPPSLWAYYQTLPKWAREDSIVRNVMMAMEYHQPDISIRNKEAQLNMACSFLRPIDSGLRNILVEAMASSKV